MSLLMLALHSIYYSPNEKPADIDAVLELSLKLCVQPNPSGSGKRQKR